MIKVDRGDAYTRRSPEVLLMGDGPKPIRLYGRSYLAGARVGSIAVVRVRPGFFGRPWIENVAYVDTARSVEAPPHASADRR